MFLADVSGEARLLCEEVTMRDARYLSASLLEGPWLTFQTIKT
jgi:hypothetical protein